MHKILRSKKFKISLVVITFVLFGYLQKSLLGNYVLDIELINSLIVFLSIVFGFSTTSLSIFSTSRFVTNLYNIPDESDPSKTLLHSLVDKYKRGLFVSLFTILYLLVLLFLATNYYVILDMSQFFTLAFSPLLVLNLIYCVALLNTLALVVIQEGKNSK